MDILEELKKVICQVQPGVNEDSVVSEARLASDLGIDSLGEVELVLALENSFGLQVSDDEMAGVRTVGEVASLVEDKLKS